MNQLDIVRAWKDEEYRMNLTESYHISNFWSTFAEMHRVWWFDGIVTLLVSSSILSGAGLLALFFKADSDEGGTFQLAAGPQATFELGREGLAMRVPERMSGHYEIRPSAFHITFKSGEELRQEPMAHVPHAALFDDRFRNGAR